MTMLLRCWPATAWWLVMMTSPGAKPSSPKRAMASVMMTPRSATKCETPPTFCEISSPLVLTSEVQKSRTS